MKYHLKIITKISPHFHQLPENKILKIAFSLFFSFLCATIIKKIFIFKNSRTMQFSEPSQNKPRHGNVFGSPLTSIPY